LFTSFAETTTHHSPIIRQLAGKSEQNLKSSLIYWLLITRFLRQQFIYSSLLDFVQQADRVVVGSSCAGIFHHIS
jgi:very-short-patch-repair endonuclease